MRAPNPVQTTAIACAAMALLGVLVAAILGHPLGGVAFAAGALIGSANGYLISRSLTSGLPFQAASLGRLAILSVVAIGAGLLIDHEVIWPVVGLAAAQMALAASAAYSLVRR